MSSAVTRKEGHRPEHHIPNTEEAILLVLDSRSCISQCSTRATDLFEITPDPNNPLPLTALFEPIEQQQLAAALRSARSGIPSAFEYWHKLSGGVRCCIEWRIQLDQDQVHLIAEGQNITRSRTVKEVEQKSTLQDAEEFQRTKQELQSSQEALKALSEFLRSTVDSLPDPLFVKDSGHRWVAVNQAFCEFVGKRSQDLLGKTDYEIFPQLVADASWQKDLEVFDKSTTLEYEEQLCDALGRQRSVLTKKSVFRDSRGSQILVGVLRDITATKQVELELVEARSTAEQATKTKTDFQTKISHEFRTPLNGIIGMSTLLLDTCLEDKQLEYAKVLKHSAEHLLEVVDDVLDLPKVESGKTDLDTELFALRDTLSTLEAMHAPLCHRKGLSFTLHVSREVPDFVQGDRRHLLQVLVNLLTNATTFTDSGGKVSLSVNVFNSKPGHAELIFSVAGNGTSEDSSKGIPQPFEGEDSSATRSLNGWGLGLAICVELVELMKGKIWTERNNNGGTNFNVQLWLDCPGLEDSSAIPHITRQHVSSNVKSPDCASHLKILVVEDNRINQRVALRMLEKADHKVVLAFNGQEAVEAFSKEEFDLVLMDVQMPIMNGYEATRALRTLDEQRGRHTPVIALTAHATHSDREACLEAGMDDYLSKPITRSRLFARLHHWCSRESANGELPTGPYVAARVSPPSRKGV